MNVAWLSQSVPYPPTSGALERSYHLLRHAARRHEVHLLALEQRRLSEGGPSLEERMTALAGFCASVRVCAMPFERSAALRTLAMGVGLLAWSPSDRIWLHSRDMHRSAADLHQRTPAALLHVDTIGLMPYAFHFRNVPVVLNHHNVESTLTKQRAEHATSPWRATAFRREARKQERVERGIAPKVATNVVVSSLDAERLRAIAEGSRIHVVENGVDTRHFTPAADPGPDGGLVFVGTLGWFANRDAARLLAAEILPALRAAGRERRLTLVGRDPRRGDWGSNGPVNAPGYVPDVRPYLRDACIYVCPLREGGGTRLKVLSALAMGKPLVATSLAVEGLRLVEGMHYLRAETTGEFVTQIGRLEDDAELRRRLGAAGRALVEREYDWSVVAGQLDAAYAAASAGTGIPW